MGSAGGIHAGTRGIRGGGSRGRVGFRRSGLGRRTDAIAGGVDVADRRISTGIASGQQGGERERGRNESGGNEEGFIRFHAEKKEVRNVGRSRS